MFDEGMPTPATRELPIVGYRHLPKQAIEALASDLDHEQADLVLRYECAHRGRTPVIRLLTARLRGLRENRAAAADAPESY